MNPIRFASHSRTVQRIAVRHGWLPAARYTNLRDVREFPRVGFVDINWKNYSFSSHLDAVKAVRPMMTVARDIEDAKNLDRIIDEAAELALWAENVLIVPKCLSLEEGLEEKIPAAFMFGYSVPTRYGGTGISPDKFKRAVHLLGGRPQDQLALANMMNVTSFDCNRFTLDAQFGDYFDGTRFRPHPIGGYEVCLEASIEAINAAWDARPKRDVVSDFN